MTAPFILTTAVGDAQSAYTDAAGRTHPGFVNLGAGQIGGGTTAHSEGTILSKTIIAMKTGASTNGRLLAQTAVTLQKNTVTPQQNTVTNVQ